MNLRFQRGDIVISAPGWSAGCFCILDIDPSRPGAPYLAVNLVNHKRYSLKEEGILKVGVATEDFLNATPSDDSEHNTAADDLRFQRGKARAERQAAYADGLTKKRWTLLAAAKSGDIFTFRQSTGLVKELKFQCVLERGTKYVFLATNSDGRLCKYPLDVITFEDKEESRPRDAGKEPDLLPFAGLRWDTK